MAVPKAQISEPFQAGPNAADLIFGHGQAFQGGQLP